MRCAVLAVVLLASCTVDDGPYGTLGNTCYSTGVCNPGLVCVDQTCVAAPPTLDGGRPVPIDAAPAVDCESDLAIEPNDMTTQAWISPIPSIASCISLVGLAVCPDTDVDLYRFAVDTNGKSARFVIRHDVAASGLRLRLLDAAGLVIALGAQPEPGTTQLIVSNLAVGTYYVRVDATAPDVVANYDLDIFTCDEIDCAATTSCP